MGAEPIAVDQVPSSYRREVFIMAGKSTNSGKVSYSSGNTRGAEGSGAARNERVSAASTTNTKNGGYTYGKKS
jgi:hypothetical protein